MSTFLFYYSVLRASDLTTKPPLDRSYILGKNDAHEIRNPGDQQGSGRPVADLEAEHRAEIPADERWQRRGVDS